MKALFPALTAIALLATPIPALTAPGEAPPKAAAAPANEAAKNTDKAEDTLLPPPPKVTRWEDTGMKPAEAQEWQHYDFKPQEAMNWGDAGFVPLVARTWSDKGFDAGEAQAWRDSVVKLTAESPGFDFINTGAIESLGPPCGGMILAHPESTAVCWIVKRSIEQKSSSRFIECLQS